MNLNLSPKALLATFLTGALTGGLAALLKGTPFEAFAVPAAAAVTGIVLGMLHLNTPAPELPAKPAKSDQ